MPERIPMDKATVRLIAKTIHDAIKKSRGKQVLVGHPCETGKTFIEGDINLHSVARAVIEALNREPPPA